MFVLVVYQESLHYIVEIWEFEKCQNWKKGMVFSQIQSHYTILHGHTGMHQDSWIIWGVCCHKCRSNATAHPNPIIIFPETQWSHIARWEMESQSCHLKNSSNAPPSGTNFSEPLQQNVRLFTSNCPHHIAKMKVVESIYAYCYSW